MTFRTATELLRKGRFDEIFFIDLPGTEEREEIFRIHLGKRGRDAEAFDTAACAGPVASSAGRRLKNR